MLNVIIKLIPVLNLIVDGIFYIVEKAEKYNDNKISKMEKENLEQWPGPSIPNKTTIKAMQDVDNGKGLREIKLNDLK